MSRPDLVRCSILSCTDVPRYVWAVVLPWTAEAVVLPPALVAEMAVLVRLCGTHNANQHGTSIDGAVRWFVGRCDRVLVVTSARNSGKTETMTRWLGEKP